MKRFITAALALIIAASLCVPVMALGSAEITNDKMEDEIKVSGDFIAAPAMDTVIFADIIWGDLTFTYKDGSKTWDVENHVDVVGEGAWETTQKPITVVNHSNVGISAKFEFAASVEGIVGAFSETEIALNTALNTTREKAPTSSVDFGISGTEISEDAEIGTITVTIQENSATFVSSESDFRWAMARTDSIKITKDINPYENIGIESRNAKNNLVVDLNGHSIGFNIPRTSPTMGISATTATLKNGTISNVNSGYAAVKVDYEATATIENCTLKGKEGCALEVRRSEVTVKDCTFECNQSSPKAAIKVGERATVTLSGNIKIFGKFSTAIERTDATATVKCVEGVYSFDPTQYVDTDLFTITDGDAGWIVSAKQ